MAHWLLKLRHNFSSGELFEKGRRVIQLLNIDAQSLRDGRDVVVYTRNRICPECSREVCIQQPEFAEHACPAAWRHHHGFSQRCPCPLIGVMRFVQFGQLRLEQRAALEANQPRNSSPKVTVQAPE